MKNLSDVGRVFYGIAITVLGALTIYYGDFPYMLIPPKHSWIPGLSIVAYISGAILLVAGVCIVSKRQARPASLLLGSVLLLIFCFYYIPYQFISTSSYMQLVGWESAEKELALASGAFIVAGCFLGGNEIPLIRLTGRLIPVAPILFAITMISFGIIHFQYAKDVADYVPAWVPGRLFWAYLAGAALIGAGVAIVFSVKLVLAATLLGVMIFIWFAILHMPRVVTSPVEYLGSEITSAFIALAYSGIAFVIAGKGKAPAVII